MEKNPNHRKFVLPEGYLDIGWQLTEESPQYHHIAKCIALGHNKINESPTPWRHFDNSLFMNRYTDEITICDECKIVWHTDMSD